jgi:hypothetical protein
MFDLNLKISSDVGLVLSEQIYKIIPKYPKYECEHVFHNY